MNTPENQISFEGEKKTCKNIYEILAHSAVFLPLIKCVFPDLKINISLEDEQLIPVIPETNEEFFKILFKNLNKNAKESFLRNEENLNIILNFFKNEENVKKFADEIEKFYLEHKEALDRAGINDSHKNAYSIAIATLRQFEDDIFLDELEDDINLSIKFTQKSNDLIKRVQDKFEEIVSHISPKHKIVGDIEGNLVNKNNIRFDHGEIHDFFDKKIVGFNKIYIDTNIRKPIIIDGFKFCGIGNNFTLPNGDKVIMVRLDDKNGNLFNKFLINETEEYNFEGKKIIRLWHKEALPNGDEVALIGFENGDIRYLTKENKIYKVYYEGIECEVCGLGKLEQVSGGEKIIKAKIIDKNGRKKNILITKTGIRKPLFSIFGLNLYLAGNEFK